MTHASSGRDGCVRCKDAGSVDSGAIDATEDAAARVHGAFRRPVLVLLEVLRTEPPTLQPAPVPAGATAERFAADDVAVAVPDDA
jgi:hypothetical protein